MLIEESLNSKYKGLAWEEEEDVDGAAKAHQLNKRLLDHFRVLAANNEETDEVAKDSILFALLLCRPRMCCVMEQFRNVCALSECSILFVKVALIDLFCSRLTCST